MSIKDEYLLSLAHDALTDEQVIDGFHRHYASGDVEKAKHDLRFFPLCCMTSAILAGERLESLLHSKSPMPGSITGLS